MAKTQEQEWSKERIQAEMKDLENARNFRYGAALVFGLSGLGAILAPVGMAGFASGGFIATFIVVGIVLVIVAIPDLTPFYRPLSMRVFP